MLGRAWDGIRKFGASGFFKGALITAAVVIGAVALVTGTMGSGAIQGFSVGGIPVRTFEDGVGRGIGKAIEFLTQSVIGWGTLAVGGLAGAFHSMRSNQKAELAAPDSENHGKLLEMAQGVQKQKELDEQPARDNLPQQQPAQQQAQKPVHTEHTIRETEHTHTQNTQLLAVEKTQTLQNRNAGNDDIYLAGSTIKGQGFSAAELKRRVERETTTEYKTVV